MKTKSFIKEMTKALASFICAALILLSSLPGDGLLTASAAAGSLFDASELFTSRDLTQTADLSEAVACEVSDGSDIHISSEGVYVLTGQASNATVYV